MTEKFAVTFLTETAGHFRHYCGHSYFGTPLDKTELSTFSAHLHIVTMGSQKGPGSAVKRGLITLDQTSKTQFWTS